MPADSAQRKRGRVKTYPDRLFLKALVIMIVQQVHTPSGLLAILAQPTAEMKRLQAILYCFLNNLDLRIGLKALLKAA